MRVFGWNISLTAKSDALSIDTVLRRLEAIHGTSSGETVTPENCMRAPTMQAIVTAISRSMATLPVRVMQKIERDDGKTENRPLPDHPVQRLFRAPNDWQTRVDYWLDAVSWLIRYGNYYAFKASGRTGPVRRLQPLPPSAVEVKLQDDLSLQYTVRLRHGQEETYTADQIHHVRTNARNGYVGNSAVLDVREAIGLEIAAQSMGATVFGNSGIPGLLLEFADNHQGFKTDEERTKFVEDFQAAFTGRKRFRGALLPKGIKLGQQIPVENEKAQFLETRQFQRNVIAGAFGVPPHMVGDLENGTFNNVEHQSLEFVQTVVLPYVRVFEAAMERDLLTPRERDQGVIIRFNVNAALRGDFKTRQEGFNIQRQAGVISPNEWREAEGRNPISADDGGDSYWQQGPSGQTAAPASETEPE